MSEASLLTLCRIIQLLACTETDKPGKNDL
jgi:hypothetical protein